MPFRLPKLRSIKVRVVIVMFLVVYVLATYVIVEKYNFINGQSNPSSSPTLELDHIVVHLDFKGAPPRLSYLQSLLPLLKKHGANGLLIEYEDMFPYDGPLRSLRGKNCYKKKELRAYLTAAVESGFEIIPLVQTFGHLEFVLKHPEFAFLREIHEHANSICPSYLETQQLLQEMLKQVIGFHTKIAPLRYIHIGCDEVYHINKCKLCQRKNATDVELFTAHIKFLIETVYILSPDTTVLIWDDMYKPLSLKNCSHLSFPDTDVVHWDYTAKSHEDAHLHMYKYGRMFARTWIATAFKGADGQRSILPNLKLRFYNHFHWLDFMFHYGNQKKLYKFKGIILTGWSRYFHDAPLCEILPASIPSLIINLILIQKYTSGIIVKDIRDLDDFIDGHIENGLDISLECYNRSDRFVDIFDSRTCHYEESDLYTILQDLINKTSIAYSIIDEYTYKYFVLKKNATRESKIEYEYVDGGYTQMETCSRIFDELITIEKEIIGLLSVYFENDVILEYVRSKIRYLQQNIQGIFRFWNRHSNNGTRSTTSLTNTAINNKLYT